MSKIEDPMLSPKLAGPEVSSSPEEGVSSSSSTPVESVDLFRSALSSDLGNLSSEELLSVLDQIVGLFPLADGENGMGKELLDSLQEKAIEIVGEMDPSSLDTAGLNQTIDVLQGVMDAAVNMGAEGSDLFKAASDMLGELNGAIRENVAEVTGGSDVSESEGPVIEGTATAEPQPADVVDVQSFVSEMSGSDISDQLGLEEGFSAFSVNVDGFDDAAILLDEETGQAMLVGRSDHGIYFSEMHAADLEGLDVSSGTLDWDAKGHKDTWMSAEGSDNMLSFAFGGQAIEMNFDGEEFLGNGGEATGDEDFTMGADSGILNAIGPDGQHVEVGDTKNAETLTLESVGEMVSMALQLDGVEEEEEDPEIEENPPELSKPDKGTPGPENVSNPESPDLYGPPLPPEWTQNPAR